MAASQAQAVVLGSTDVPTVSAFMSAFEQQHYNPKIFIAAAGPDQGSAFTSAVGLKNANGMHGPRRLVPGLRPTPPSQAMVQAYVAKLRRQPVGHQRRRRRGLLGRRGRRRRRSTHRRASSNAKIISYLHSGVTLSSVQGPVKFNALGENLMATAFIFQWQNGKFVQVLPAGAAGSVQIEYPKPVWGS